MDFKQFFLILPLVYVNVNGHGMLYDPPNRSSLWRFGYNTPPNYDDNGNNCGGFGTQHYENGGKCGICGDDYRKPLPRPNELGGKYGKGIIVKTYSQGSKIEVTVKITAAHSGYFTFDLCNLDEDRETEKCFKRYPLKTSDGRDQYYIGYVSQKYLVRLTLPPYVTCKHCVLRWQYTAGNNCPGCEKQETFRTCSDIKITPKKKGGYKKWGKIYI